MRETAIGKTYVINIAGHLVEVPDSAYWRIRETVEEDAPDVFKMIGITE